jgi:hypothetical protein
MLEAISLRKEVFTHSSMDYPISISKLYFLPSNRIHVAIMANHFKKRHLIQFVKPSFANGKYHYFLE